MKVSARNNLSGVIVKIELGAINAEVHVKLKSGVIVIGMVTKESINKLGLALDKPVLALIKSSQIIVVTEMEGYRLSARNQLTGIVADVKPGAVNAEIDIALGDSELIVATVTLESLKTMGLTPGKSATAVFKAGAVILAVPA